MAVTFPFYQVLCLLRFPRPRVLLLVRQELPLSESSSSSDSCLFFFFAGAFFCNRFLLLRCFLWPHVFIAPVLASLTVTNLLIGLVVLRAAAAPPRLVPGTSPDTIELRVLGPVRLRRGNRPSWFTGRFDRAWLV